MDSFMNQRLEPEARRAVIVTAAITLANENGLAAVTHDAVARSCSFKTTGRTVKHYFPRISELWKAVVDDGRAHQTVVDEAVGMGIV